MGTSPPWLLIKPAKCRAGAKSSPGSCWWGGRRDALLHCMKRTAMLCLHAVHVCTPRNPCWACKPLSYFWSLRWMSHEWVILYPEPPGSSSTALQLLVRAGKQPCKWKAWSCISCHLPGCSHNILEQLPRETAFKNKWPQPNHPNKVSQHWC